MTPLAQLADRAQAAVSDTAAGTWSQEQIEEWALEAIRDYSNYFPRRLQSTIATAAGDRQYDLPAGTLALLSVEYPTGQDPPEYLDRRPYTHPDFWIETGYYDFFLPHDPTDQGELYISEKPAAGETITIHCTAIHDVTVASGDTITVPAQHEPILIEFVVWRAWLERLGKEQQAPTSNSSLLLNQYASNADRARRNYVQALGRARVQAAGESRRAPWKLDKWDRSY